MLYNTEVVAHYTHQKKIRYYAEARNEWLGPSPQLSVWAKQLRRKVATVASRRRHRADLTYPGIEPQTSRTDSVRAKQLSQRPVHYTQDSINFLTSHKAPGTCNHETF